MTDLNQLHEQHVNLAALGGHLSAIIGQDAPPPSRELHVLRMEFASALIRHLKIEDWTLYPSLLASSNDRVALTSRAFSAEMGGLAKAFGDYANRWGANAIERDWEGYQRETAEILRTLLLRIAREERDLYPLVEATGRPLHSSSSPVVGSSARADRQKSHSI